MPGQRRPQRDSGTSDAKIRKKPVTAESNSDTPESSPSAGGSEKTWTLSGRLRVRESETTGESLLRDLVKVEIEVCASDVGADGPWTEWGKVRTNASGEWSLRHTQSGENRFFRVRARLSASDLEVNDSDINDVASLDLLDLNWRTVWKSEAQLSGPNVDVGARAFAAGNPYELGNETWRRQALIWYAVRTAMDRMVAEDPWFAFKSKIAVIYPAHVISGVSYANGLTRMAYLHETSDGDDWKPDVALHEVMHLWNYDHNVGTSNWLAAVCSLRGSNPIDLDTHARQENPNVAFHEGFAEWAAQAFMNEFWGARKVRPFNRHFVFNDLKLTTLNMVEKFDDGVTHGLHMLQSKGEQGWWKHLFGTVEALPTDMVNIEVDGEMRTLVREVGVAELPPRSLPEGRVSLTMWEVLRVFRANPAAGWDTDWQVGNSTFGLLRFIDRAVDIFELGEDLRVMFKRCLDPLATEEPVDSLVSRPFEATKAGTAPLRSASVPPIRR